MPAAMLALLVGSVVSVVYDTLALEMPEKAMDGKPSSAASVAAPL